LPPEDAEAFDACYAMAEIAYKCAAASSSASAVAAAAAAFDMHVAYSITQMLQSRTPFPRCSPVKTCNKTGLV
jgi:hypothetical protein